MNSLLSFELGMPHLGRHNLNENSLLKVIGHDRWRIIEEAGKIKSSNIRDEEHNRLYATFYFVELELSPERPLSFYGENQQLSFRADLSHYERVYIDGRYALADGGPFRIRASNVFIYQLAGPSKLAMAPPANMCFDTIPALESQPDSLDLCRSAKKAGRFFDGMPQEHSLGSREIAYELDPDRDMNGAGLVYFANFVCFMDYAERHFLSELKMPDSLLDARSTYQRRIGYFGNAKEHDRLNITIAASLLPLEANLLSMKFDYRLCRSSDGKEIAVSSARKVARPDNDGAEWVNKVIRKET